MTTFKFSTLNSPTGASLAVYTWTAAKDAHAVIHINHGMSEHCARYDRFAKALNAAGYHVIAHDHRGHGKTTAPDSHQGLFAKTDGVQKVLDDVTAVNTHARETFKGLPLVLFGHSMGTIIGLNYCIRHADKIDAAALWNSGVDGGALLAVYRFLLAVERMFKGSDVPSTLARKLTFETWNKEFKPNRTVSDWLSSDEAEVDKY
ncbi:MAG: alpha/beta hydrolase, partial [Pseudomonadota bacterium]